MRMLAKVHVLDPQPPRLWYLFPYKGDTNGLSRIFQDPKYGAGTPCAEHDADVGHGYAKRSLGASRVTWSGRITERCLGS